MEIIIIGSGPAGITAAIYLKRMGIECTIISNGIGTLKTAKVIENYYGFKSISGEELHKKGEDSAKALGIKIINDEVVGITFDDDLNFIVDGVNDSYKTQKLILATGTKRVTTSIKGLKAFEGSGVSYCATCDGFFYRDKDVCVLGNGEYALAEANVLLKMAKNIKILTNNTKPLVEFQEGVKIIEKEILSINGDEKLESITFSDGEKIKADGLFIALGTAGATDLAKKIGAITSGNYIKVDENMKTNVNNLYAIGDAVGGMLQVSKAIYDGARVAQTIRKDND